MAVLTPHRDSESPPTWDTLFEILSSSRRRHLLSALDDERDTPVSDLVDRIASTEEDCPPEALTQEQTTPVRVSLHHVHLPALREAGLVAWDRRARTATLTPDADDLPIFESFDRPLVSLHGTVTEVQKDV